MKSGSFRLLNSCKVTPITAMDRNGVSTLCLATKYQNLSITVF